MPGRSRSPTRAERALGAELAADIARWRLNLESLLRTSTGDNGAGRIRLRTAILSLKRAEEFFVIHGADTNALAVGRRAIEEGERAITALHLRKGSPSDQEDPHGL